jgi:large subunit ribosomal protein L54
VRVQSRTVDGPSSNRQHRDRATDNFLKKVPIQFDTRTEFQHPYSAIMICRRCLLRATHSRQALPSLRRAFNSSTPESAEASTATHPPSAKPSSATQPFTTPPAISPTGHGEASSEKKKENTLVLSSIPAGTALKGINYLKNKTDPVAMEDSEYPSWLWDILKTKTKTDEAGEAGDLYCMFCAQLRPSTSNI